jgi:hypothetical protein
VHRSPREDSSSWSLYATAWVVIPAGSSPPTALGRALGDSPTGVSCHAHPAGRNASQRKPSIRR